MYNKAKINKRGYCENCAYYKGTECKALKKWFSDEKKCFGCTFFKTVKQVQEEKKIYPYIS